MTKPHKVGSIQDSSSIIALMFPGEAPHGDLEQQIKRPAQEPEGKEAGVKKTKTEGAAVIETTVDGDSMLFSFLRKDHQ